MIGWIIRILLVLVGTITSFFVARDALNFDIIQMVVGLMLCALIILIAAFWPSLKEWFKRITK